MLWAYQQSLDPLAARSIPISAILSTIVAALPVVVLFWLLVPRRWLAPKAGLGGALVAIVLAVLVYGMSPVQAGMSFAYGAAFGLLPVGWTVFAAMLLYNITVETGQFTIIRRSVAGLSGDARVQAVLIGFAFGAFLEGAAGGGTPVAICGAIMVGLGFHPFKAAVLCLIANTSPVAYGGLGTPLITLNGVTDLDTFTLSQMAGRQLPLLSFIIPIWMVRCMVDWKKTFEVWPALVVAGGSFAVFQFVFAHSKALYNMTDIGGGIFSLIVTAIFLRYWKPKNEWHYPPVTTPPAPTPTTAPVASSHGEVVTAAASPINQDVPLSVTNVTLAWAPFALMSILLMMSGIVRQWEDEWKRAYNKEGKPIPTFLGVQSLYLIDVPFLHKECFRDKTLSENPNAEPKGEAAVFQFIWLTAPGTSVMVSALLSMAMLRMNSLQIRRVLAVTVRQMRVPIPTIAVMLGLSYVTRYAGMDATLGYAFANTGAVYPFFAAILGWLGVFLTGTDAGSNALFGSLQKITASKIFDMGVITQLTREQAQVLICTANSTGGVMGKMIDAQSICVATAATHQVGKEADIFKAVIWHSIVLAAIVGAMTLLQAYVWPFTLSVPMLPTK